VVAPLRQWANALRLALLLIASVVACRGVAAEPQRRERAAERDTGCTDPQKPSAYFYPAENRTDYAPDDPFKDGCSLLVSDHLFCCPNAPRPEDR
jgi:hypothetical protein